MLRLITLLSAVFITAASVTLLLHYLTRRYKVVKYLPGGLSLLLSIYYYYLSTTSYANFEDIARILMAIILFVGSVAGLAVSLFQDFLLPRIKRN